MLNRINLLNNETSNKIAAGEVVERPASAVKELIENSIDAKSKNITVEINGGGKQRIKITDDGHGIHPLDIEKAFMPHGTSKISVIEDLYSINTFGFRGEALPSIAAVSKVNLKSKTNDNVFGKEIMISGGNIDYAKETGCNVGTTIEVTDMFYNVPARQKFLKTEQRESTLISNIVNRLALANHNVSFKYYNNNKKSLITFSSDDVRDTIRCIYGKNTYDNLINFEKHMDVVSVYGYIGTAEISRGSRNNQSIFVNKRYIKSGLITSAVENAFKSFLTINKHPFFVLFLDIYPEFIDVNVHPTKSEVKFQDERMIYKIVFDSVHKALGDSMRKSFNMDEGEILTIENVENVKVMSPCKNHMNLDSFSMDNSEINKINAIKDNENTHKKQLSQVEIPIDLKETNYTLNRKEDSFSMLYEKTINEENKINYLSVDYAKDKESTNKEYFIELNLDKETILNKKSNENNNSKNDNAINHHIKIDNKSAKFPKINIIGQFNNTYILGEYLNEFYMIDQHAAHEKILFEKFKNQIENRHVVSQILLTPIVIELSLEDYNYYNENIDIFKESGFITELFGDNTISIREAPMLLKKVNVREFFLEILDNIKNMGSGKITEVKYNMIASLACKAAIKANHPLNTREMEALIEDLRYIEEPFNCPHGRPTIVKTTLKDIEKKFKRIQ